MTTVQVGVQMPLTPLAKDRVAAVRRVEEAGIDHLMVGDHVSFFGGFGFDGLIQTPAYSPPATGCRCTWACTFCHCGTRCWSPVS